MTESIPQPPTVPFLGNVFDMDRETPVMSMALLAKKYGPILQLSLGGERRVFINGHKLALELTDESRFRKVIRGALLQVRNVTGDGLFTAHHGEENWGIAHRILMPAFGPASIRGMFDDMVDILSQCILKWERFGPKHAIDPTDDFTRLAFDTVALCVMSYRLNSFYTEGVPPFVEAMGSFLLESGSRANRPSVLQMFMSNATVKYEEDQRIMLDLAREIVNERKATPTDRRDLLNLMLNGRDSQTGKGLSDENIMGQMITFLIAGHETSSGLLSFTMYEILKHPEVYQKIQAEVDSVLGKEHIRPEHLAKFPYLTAVMRESIRLHPPATGFGLSPFEDTLVGDGKYLLRKDEPVFVVAYTVHRDPEVWGEDAEEFKPERMLDGKFEALPPKAWVPFGNGARACIGRPFAWQEVTIALATLFQRFAFRMEDESYILRLKQTLTIKPNGFKFFAIPRTDGPTSFLGPTKSVVATSNGNAQAVTDGEDLRPRLSVLYGSNTGSCEMFAQRLAHDATFKGFRARIGTLDSVSGTLDTGEPAVIVTASFEGQPADNAAHFVAGLKTLNGTPLMGLKYAVFGCGNRDWVHTYQRIPRYIDEALAERGGERLLERGEADASGETFFESFDDWEVKFWDKLTSTYGAHATEDSGEDLVVDVKPPTERATSLRHNDAQTGEVVANHLISQPGEIEKHHIEIRLPEGMAYRSGDYLAVLPTNPLNSVRRALARLGLSADQEITISSTSPTTLPVDKPVNITVVLSGYVELAQPATRKNLEALLKFAPYKGATRAALEQLSANHKAAVLDKRLSVLNILEFYPDIQISLAQFSALLPAMRIRQYSISSSPLWNPAHVTLTIGVLTEASLADSNELFQGVGSNFLANLKPGDRVQVAIRPSGALFHLPEDPAVPIVMFASGTGIAPMRGFIQERAVQKTAGREVGRAILFYGCRAPDVDFLYSDTELREWTEQGVVEVRPAFSRASKESEGCKYVQDRVWHDRQDIVSSFDAGAKFYACGASRTAEGIRDACVKIIMETNPSDTQEQAEGKFAQLQRSRFAADVFG